FSHFAKLSEDEIIQVEEIVNEKIREDIELDEKRNVPIDEAKTMGATALFGEKYGDFVRVVTFDPDFSRELCGGTHVSRTGKIGFFKIISESSSAAGIRRIEAITAIEVEKMVREQSKLLSELGTLLKSNNIKQSVESVLSERAQLEKEIELLKGKETELVKSSLLNKTQEKGGVNFLIEMVELPDANALKQLSYELRNQIENLVLVLAANINGKPQIAVMVSDSLTGNEDKNYHAGNLVKELAHHIKGGGGGQPFYATAGGKDLEGLLQVVKSAREKFIV
ncbi:MAG: DHHA1 domain-containing protein, partial [Cyclobacteriaceae bacterium]|nr:DHHA1 domain-containing protein [Cyclobacteriaceae bacterium]